MIFNKEANINISPKDLVEGGCVSKRFKFLDSIRGMCALIVMIVHAQGLLKSIQTNGLLKRFDSFFDSMLKFVSNYSHAFAVNGFFLLSSFLLTYRLIDDFSKTNNSIRMMFKVIVKFFIRRLFRVYLPYLVFCSAVAINSKYAGGDLNYASWLNMVTLKETGSNPLWTVPPEIKFYALLPVICMPAAFCKVTN